MNQQKGTIGILGGMGPLATADLFQKIITLTQALKDNDHIRVCIDSNTNIPDRTNAILHGGETPLNEMVRSALLLEAMGADILIMPCNTAHYFYNNLLTFVHIPFLNMLEETAKAIVRKNINKVGLLATDGTIEAGVYDTVLKKYGIQVCKPEKKGQKAVMDIIYKGIKAGNDSIDLTEFKAAVNQLLLQAAETIVLGCTELPIAFEKFHIEAPAIDPTCELAKSAILFVGGNLKKKSVV